MDKITFENDKDNNIVIFNLDNNENTVWIEKYYVDESSLDTISDFCKMLQEGFNKCIEKGYETHTQIILRSEFVNNPFIINNDRWEVIHEDDDYITIECDIHDATVCIIESFFGKSIDELNAKT
jgi:hypothetical protein